jgi:hypothetical protein
MKKFDEVYSKIIRECNTSLFNKKLYENHWFAPCVPFQITKDMLIDDGYPFKDIGNWAGKVIEILSDDEIIYEVWGKYFEREENINLDINNSLLANISNFCRIRCKPFQIRYKLKPGESYYICDKVDPYCNWLKVLYNLEEPNNEIETEEGECAGDIGGAGITTNSVFGSGNSCGDSVIQNSHKDPNGPGITTHDMRAMYTLHLDPKRSKNYPVFKRKKI